MFGSTAQASKDIRDWTGCPMHHNRFLTVLVYLSECGGGSTSFPVINTHKAVGGKSFYKAPSPLSKADFHANCRQNCKQVVVKPKQGLALIHFPTTVPKYGGVVDGNACHQGDPVTNGTKYVIQQFIFSCDFPGEHVLPEYDRPTERLSDTTC